MYHHTMTNIIVVAHELKCPTCGASECHPTREDRILIRAYKVDGYSQCLVCSGHYDAQLNETPDNHNPKKGWFR